VSSNTDLNIQTVLTQSLACLLVPMIIMIFTKSTNANLIICSVFVLAFGAIVSFGTKSSNQEIVGATAGELSCECYSIYTS
jgi:FtsH-binding integral membrane protein